jgi:diguanylate cyclase (GGDEF)-like protein
MRSKLIIAIFIGCLIPYVTGGLYLKSLIERWLYHNSVDNTNQVLEQVNELIDQTLVQEMDNLLTLLSSVQDVKNSEFAINNYLKAIDNPVYDDNEIEKSIESIFQHFKESHDTINFIFLGTESGGYMEYPRFIPSQNYDPRERPWYQNTIVHDDIEISEPYITNVSNEMVISFTKHIMNGDHKVGVIGISVRLEDLMNNINGIQIGDTGYILLLSPEHRFLVSPEYPDWVMKTSEELGLHNFKDLITKKDTSFEAELDGVTRVFNVITSKESGFHLVSVVNKSEILHTANEITTILNTIYIITFIFIFIIVYQLSRTITKPILEISSVIHRMTHFDFNIDDHKNIKRYTTQNDEIGIVAKALVKMHHNYYELMEQVHSINDAIKNIDIEKKNSFRLSLSKDNPFHSIISSMNILLDKIHQYFDQLKATNSEILTKNELLTSSEEELMAQLDEINQQKDYIHYLAFHDPLTGLPNRRRFTEKLNSKISHGQFGAVILLDLDDFKGINDTLGHMFGDRVLESIAQRIEEAVDYKIFVSRFGGDEFLILIETDQDYKYIEDSIKKIKHIFDEKITIEEHHIDVHFSMGISLFPKDSTDVDQLVVYADLAMYSVKNAGKNDYQFFDIRMMDDQMKKSNIEIILREAIDQDGFHIVYQPQIDIKTGQVNCYEALLRLRDYSISPTEFIDIAEKNGSIIRIGRIVTEKVIQQLSSWKNEGQKIKPVSINFSAHQLHDGDYINYINSLLSQYGIDARYIEIEITENIFLENRNATLLFLKQLKELGIQIAIDDFGTGYSSLNYLTFLPVDKIKLDRSLNLKFLEMDNIKVMDSLISLVHSLNLTVTAEGIETLDHVKRLQKGGCDYIQGYYFSKPLDADQIPTIHDKIFNNY